MKKGAFDTFQSFLFRHKWWGFSLAVLISIAGAYLGRDLPIRLSLVELLPDNRESVQDFKAVSKEFGGVGYLGIVFGPVENPEKFLPQASAALLKIPEVRYVFSEREPYTLRDKALYVISREDFDGVLENVEVMMNKGKTGGFLDLGFDDNEDVNRKIASADNFFASIREKYMGGKATMATRHQKYFLSPDGKHAVLWVKPSFDSENLALSKKLLSDVQVSLDKTFEKETEKAPFQFWGRYINHVRDTDQVKSDINLTGWISLLAVVVVLIFGLGSFRGAVVAVLGMILSMGWTMGCAKLVVGQINIITGFLLAILGGLGVEYGIHLVRRYYQERRAGQTHEGALETSYTHVGRALFSAALTSAGAFLILSMSDFRGFSELGKIAGLGILSIYLVYMLTFPALASFLPREQTFNWGEKLFGTYFFSKAWKWSLAPLALMLVWGLQHTRFEYDFKKLTELSSQARTLDDLVRSVVSRSTTPAAMLASTPEEAKALNDYWNKNHHSDPVMNTVLDQTLSLETLIPADMQERSQKLEKFRKHIGSISDKEIQDKTGLDAGLVRAWVAQKPYTIDDLPVHIWDGLGKTGRIVLAYPKVELSHARGIAAFSGFLQDAKSHYPGLKIGSDVRIFDEILHHIVVDGRTILLLFLVGVFFVLWLDFRNVREALLLELQLVMGIALLSALMGFFDIPFSILNIAMVPAVLAAGIDMGVHVRHREMESGENSLKSAKFIAQAVHLGALTTVLGFGSLFLADASMLKGIAWISVLGQVSMYLICMLVWPVCKTLVQDLMAARRGLSGSSEGLAENSSSSSEETFSK